MSESASEAGPRIFRIFVGARGACASETMEAAREVATEAPAWDLIALGFEGSLREGVADGVSGPPRENTDPWAEARLSVSTLAFVMAAAAAAFTAADVSSESFSPTHVLANQRPPAIPLISRFAVRQRRGLLVLLSRGITGANPVGILGGG